jgi:hypothetical protein
MKWLETIKVQAASGQEFTAERELLALTHDIRKSSQCPGVLHVEIYRHIVVPGYFALYLFWETKSPQIQGSMLGLQLKQTLKTFGLVDHTVWTEQM